jgi:hypothetical protein
VVPLRRCTPPAPVRAAPRNDHPFHGAARAAPREAGAVVALRETLLFNSLAPLPRRVSLIVPPITSGRPVTLAEPSFGTARAAPRKLVPSSLFAKRCCSIRSSPSGARFAHRSSDHQRAPTDARRAWTQQPWRTWATPQRPAIWMKMASDSGFCSASRLTATPGSTPARIRFTGTSHFLPLRVRGIC